MRRAGRRFAKNLLWMVVAFGIVAAIVVASTSLPLAKAMAFVGTAAGAATVVTAIVAALVLVTNARDETPIDGRRHHPGWSPGPRGVRRDGGGWDGSGGLGGGGGGGG